MGKKKIITKPKSLLGFADKVKICYNCMFYGFDGYCPWEETYKKYNEKCTKILNGIPSTFFRYRLDLPYKIDEIKLNK